ncbi:MAG: hypothetical protein K1X78_00060 [Verrucomicrobiaceae bacterium]|nr:hypothetical protein [Verrucomicrobiaceae bacterium]
MKNLLARAQEQARRFNEDEAVLCEFERLQLLRKLSDPFSRLPEEIADELDWREAVATCRPVRAIGCSIA